MTFGEGGSIPFMGMLGARYPEAQFLITGVLGPHSNAHGPNEFLHIGYAKKLTACVAQVLADERDSALRRGRPAYCFSPASIRIGSRFCSGGSGQVANGVNAQGGL